MYGDEKVMEILRKVAEKTGSQVAKERVKDEEYHAACHAANLLFQEMWEDYEEGEMDWKEAVNELKENLLAIDMPVPPEAEEEEMEDEKEGEKD